MNRRRWVGLVAVLLMVGPFLYHCGGGDGGKNGGGNDGGNSNPGGSAAADDLLRQSDVVKARDAYRSLTQAAPQDAHVAFGAALTSLILLPDAQAVTEFLDKCGQPHVNVAQFFGSSGLLAKYRDERQGSGTVTVGTSSSPSGPFTNVALAGVPSRTTTEGSGTGYGNRTLDVSVKDIGYAGGRGTATLDLSMYPGTAAPLHDGVELNAANMTGGYLYLDLPSVDGKDSVSYSPTSGTILFEKVGTGQTGDVVSVTFKNIVLTGYPDSCSFPCAPQYARIDGKVSDVISSRSKATLPFAGVSYDDGPPARTGLIVALDRCPGLSAEYLRGQVQKLVPELEAIANDLQVVTQSASSDAFQFTVPGGLLFVDGDIPVNIADVRILKAGVEAALAGISGATQYKTSSKTFAELMGTFQSFGLTQRGFMASLLRDDLNAYFLARADGFDLTAMRTWLTKALDDLSDAVTIPPKAAGLTDFQSPAVQDLKADVARQLAFAKKTLTTAGRLPLEHSPGYEMCLKSLFDDPIDFAKLHAAPHTSGIFSVQPGDPNYGTNDELTVDGNVAKQLAEPVFKMLNDGAACNPSADPSGCPADYRCSYSTSTCVANTVTIVDPTLLRNALPRYGLPLFVSFDGVKPLLQLRDFQP
jgi:hypothetical protein